MRTLALTTWRPIGVALLWMCAATFLVGCTTSGFSATPDEARGWTVPRWLTEDRRSPAKMAALCALSWFSCGNRVKYVTFVNGRPLRATRGRPYGASVAA